MNTAAQYAIDSAIFSDNSRRAQSPVTSQQMNDNKIHELVLTCQSDLQKYQNVTLDTISQGNA